MGHRFRFLLLAFILPASPFSWLCSTSFSRRPRPWISKVSRSLSSSLFVTTSTSEDVQSVSPANTPLIKGLARDFDRKSNLDGALLRLRRQIPLLLQVPLTDLTGAGSEVSAKTTPSNSIYSSDVKLVARNHTSSVLCSSFEELVSISNTVVLAVAASKRATELLSFIGRRTNIESDTGIPSSPSDAVLNGRIILHEVGPDKVLDWQRLSLEWSTDIVIQSGQVLGGIADIELNNQGQISLIRIMNVHWEDVERGTRTDVTDNVGQLLASLRSSVLNLQESSWWAGGTAVMNSPASSVLSQVRDQLFRPLIEAVSGPPGHSVPMSPELRMPVFVSTIGAANETLVPLDEYTDRSIGDAALSAIPGTPAWREYAEAHRLAERFVRKSIPVLSGIEMDQNATTEFGSGPDLQSIQSILSPDCYLVTQDGSLLLGQQRHVAKTFHSLALLRSRFSGSTFVLRQVELLRYNSDGVTVGVQFNSTLAIGLPGVVSTLTVDGEDIYTLDQFGRIREIRQKSQSINQGSPRESQWLMRSLATAIETGTSINDDFLLDLLQGRLGRAKIRRSVNSQQSRESERVYAYVRSDFAAATIYRIMDALHREVPPILDTRPLSSSSPSSAFRQRPPPLVQFMDESIILEGYLGEELIRGRSSYESAWDLLHSSLFTGLRSGVLVLEKHPVVAVELTSERNVRSSVTIHLQVHVALARLAPQIDSDTAGRFPLHLTCVSDYIVDPVDGRVVRHVLRETRINGQLTPGDVLARLIVRLQDAGSSSSLSSLQGHDDDDSRSLWNNFLTTLQVMGIIDR